MLNVKINGTISFSIQSDGEEITLDGRKEAFDLQKTGEQSQHIIRQNKSYSTELVSFDRESKSGMIRVNSTIYHFSISDQYDDLLEKLGIDRLSTVKISELKAPMPGLVLDILVQEGQEVKKGDNLLILEAMKMENIIKSPADLKIGAIKAISGDKVEKNQVLLAFH